MKKRIVCFVLSIALAMTCINLPAGVTVSADEINGTSGSDAEDVFGDVALDDSCEEEMSVGTNDISADISEIEALQAETVELTGEGSCGDNMTWRLYYHVDDKGTTKTSDDERWYQLYIDGYGPMYDYMRRDDTFDWDKVAPWYKACSDNQWAPTEIYLGEGITTIGNAAFSGFKVRKMPEFPASLQSIGEFAFYMCGNMEGELKVPDGLTTIKSYAFFACSKLSGDLIFPDSVTNLGAGAFQNCTNLKGTVQLPANLVEIPDSAFQSCPIQSVTFPSELEKIGKRAFSSTKLSGPLNLPDSVNEIGWFAFSLCSGLTGDLIIPDKVTVITAGVFSNCGFDGQLVMHDQVKSIGENAFSGCSKLTGNLNIPAGVQNIGQGAFDGCSGLSGSVVIPDVITEIGEYTFRQCVNIEDIDWPDALVTIGSQAFYGCGKLPTEITLPDGVKYVYTHAFYKSSVIKINFLGDEPTVQPGDEQSWGPSFNTDATICYSPDKSWNVDEENHKWKGYSAYKIGEMPPRNITFVAPAYSEIEGYSTDSTQVVLQTNGAGYLEKLPMVTMDGMTFMGWYTEKDGEGDAISDKHKYSEDITLYAHLVKLYGCTDFDYATDYFKVSSFPSTNNEKGKYWNYELMETLKSQVGPFSRVRIDNLKLSNDINELLGSGGWCYGMSVMAGLFYTGKYKPEMFQAESVSKLAPSDELNKLITYYFLCQGVDSIKKASKGNEKELGKRLVDTLRSGKGPCIVNFDTYEGTGHTLLAYAVDIDSDVNNYIIYTANSSAVRPMGNHIEKVDPHLIYLDKETYVYTRTKSGSGSEGSSEKKITGVVSDLSIYEDFYVNYDAKADKVGSIFTNMKNFSVLNSSNDELALDGPYLVNRDYRNEISDMCTYFVNDEDSYRIVNKGDTGYFMMTCDDDVTMSGINSNASEFVIEKSGKTSIYGATEESVITVCSNIDGQYYPVDIRTTSEQLSVEAGEHGIVLDAEEEIGTVYISVDGGEEKKVVVDDSTYEMEIQLPQERPDNSYTVKCIGNGATAGEMKDYWIEIGNRTNLKENSFERTGYTFAGWNTKADGSGTAYADCASVKNLSKKKGATVKLYARWKAITYKVAFDENGGVSKDGKRLSNQTLTYNKKQTLKKNIYSRKGYSFKGWATSPTAYADNEVAENPLPIYANEANAKFNMTTVKGEVVTLYAQWKLKNYKISYKNVGGNTSYPVTDKGGNIASYTVVDDSFILNDATRKGYTFAGWYTKSDYRASSKIIEVNTSAAKDYSIYAKWKANKYIVHFDGNGNTNAISMPDLTFTVAKDKELPKNLFKKTGYKFAGWKVVGDNTNTYYDGRVVKNKALITKPFTFDAAGEITLEAQWKPITYTVKFSANGGANVEIESKNMICTYDETMIIPCNIYAKEGYDYCECYSTKKSGYKAVMNGTSDDLILYEIGSEFKNLTTTDGAEVVLYAQYVSID